MLIYSSMHIYCKYSSLSSLKDHTRILRRLWVGVSLFSRLLFIKLLPSLTHYEVVRRFLLYSSLLFRSSLFPHLRSRSGLKALLSRPIVPGKTVQRIVSSRLDSFQYSKSFSGMCRFGDHEKFKSINTPWQLQIVDPVRFRPNAFDLDFSINQESSAIAFPLASDGSSLLCHFLVASIKGTKITSLLSWRASQPLSAFGLLACI